VALQSTSSFSVYRVVPKLGACPN